MKKTSTPTAEQLRADNEELRARLEEAEETLRAIREGEVDAVIVSGSKGDRVFALSETENMHRLMVETMNEAGLAATPDGLLVFCNDRAASLLGCTKEQLLGHDLAEFAAPADAVRLRQLLQAAAIAPADARIEFRVSAGMPVPMHVWASRLDRPDSPLICLVATDLSRVEADRDLIAQLQRQREQLRESEDRFRSLFEQSPDAVFLTVPETGEVRNANPAACVMFGMTEQELRGVSRGIIVPEDGRLASALEERKRTGRVRTELTCVRKNGQRFPAEETSVIVPGDPQRSFVIMRDITARKQGEQELTQTKTQLETLLATAPLGFCHFDRELRYLRINDRLAVMNGIPAADHLGKTIAEFVPALVPAVQEVTARILATGEAVVGHEFSGETPAQPGVTRWWSESWYPVHDASGAITGFGVIVEDITARKQAEEALTQMSRLLAEGQKIAHLGSFEYVADSQTTVWSEEEFRIYGLDPAGQSPSYEDLLAKHIHPDDAALLHATFTAALRNGTTYDQEHRIVQPDGSVRWVYDRANPFFDGCGNLIRYIGTTLDITERKLTEEALAAAHQRIQSLIDNTPAIVYAFDQEGRFVLANTTVAKLFNATPAQMIGKRRHDFMPQADAEWHEANDRKVIAAGTALEFEEYSQLPEHTITWLTTKFPLRDAQGRIYAVAGISNDITERKQAEDQLHRLNRTLQAHTDSNRALLRLIEEPAYLQEICRIIVEDCGHAMVWVGFAENDEDKTVRPVAAAGFEEGYLDTLQLTWADTERGRGPTGTAIRTGQYSTCRDMLNDPKFAPWRAEALKRGYASSAVFPLLADGRAFGALTIYSREPGAFTGEEVKLLTELAGDFSFGITTLRLRVAHAAAEDAVRELNAELEQRVQSRTAELDATNRELEAFSYSVSHDLRTPLRSLDGFSQALLEDYGPLLDATGKDYLARIRSNSQRMGRLIDDLLNLSRLTRAHMRHTTVDLTALAETVVAELRKADPSRTVDVRIAPGLAATGDPTLLGTVISNLLENAWKFTSRRADAVIEMGAERLPVPADAILPEREGVPLPVPADSILPEREGVPLPVPAIAALDATLPEREGVPLPVFTPVFFVRDNGVGFDTHYADKLFVPFQRLHSIDEFPGSGVGLATVQRVIRRHGGRVWFKSAPGQGAAFFFTIGSADEVDQNATCGAVLAAVSDSK